MTILSVYSNHAGTLSESYAIGKRGIKILQGFDDPSGVVAPTGSLYILRGETANRVYQIDSVGVWSALLSPYDITAGPGVSVEYANGTVSIGILNTKFKQQFTQAFLIDGLLLVEHNLGEEYPVVQLYNDNREVIQPDEVLSIDDNSFSVGLSSYADISGTWTVTAVSGTPTTKFKLQFTDDLLESGILTVHHNLKEDFPLIQIYNESKQIVIPDTITSVGANSIEIGLASYGSISGTWTVSAITN